MLSFTLECEGVKLEFDEIRFIKILKMFEKRNKEYYEQFIEFYDAVLKESSHKSMNSREVFQALLHKLREDTMRGINNEES